MRYTTLEEYDKELKELEKLLKEIEEHIKNHPEELGTQGNYETLKYLYTTFKNDKLKFIEEVSEINLKLSGDIRTKGMKISELTKLSNNFNETERLTTKLIENTIDSEELLINGIVEGSYNITFNFHNPTEEDVKRTSFRKKGLIKIFDFINCGDDIEKLKKESCPEGHDALAKYKEFLMEIVKHNADFTLDTEKGNLKAGLSITQCQNICKNLNI